MTMSQDCPATHSNIFHNDYRSLEVTAAVSSTYLCHKKKKIQDTQPNPLTIWERAPPICHKNCKQQLGDILSIVSYLSVIHLLKVKEKQTQEVVGCNSGKMVWARVTELNPQKICFYQFSPEKKNPANNLPVHLCVCVHVYVCRYNSLGGCERQRPTLGVFSIVLHLSF